MDNRNYSRSRGRAAGRPQQPAQHRSAARPNYGPDEMDRYNYVDRDIYSSSSDARRYGNAPPRKGGCAKKFFTTFFVLLLLAAVGGFLYFNVMASRLDRSEGTYVQQVSGAPTDANVKNILLLGIDENEDGSDGRSDSILMMSIDSQSKKLRLVSFLRDTYLDIPGYGKNKLNAAFADGSYALTLQTLENSYRINVNKYVSVNFNNFAKVIDKMGGLDVPMSEATCLAENQNMGSRLKPGVNHLNGKLCLYYARIRHASDSFGHDDYGRTARQRQVIQLMFQKLKSMNPVQANKILYDSLPYVKTNLSNAELAELTGVSFSLSSYQTESKQIPAMGTFTSESVKNIGDILVPNLEKNRQILKQFLYGGTDSAENGG